MGQRRDARITAAAEAVLGPDERVTAVGLCWAAQLRDRVPLLFLGRHQHCMALTDRRVLVFERNRSGPTAEDLVVGKRYDTFTLERVKRRRPLLQLLLRAANGSRMVFEFRPGQRGLGGELAARLAPRRDRTRDDAPGAGEPSAPTTSTDAASVESSVSTAFWGSA